MTHDPMLRPDTSLPAPPGPAERVGGAIAQALRRRVIRLPAAVPEPAPGVRRPPPRPLLIPEGESLPFIWLG